MNDDSTASTYTPYFMGVFFALAILLLWYILVILVERTLIASASFSINNLPSGISFAAIIAAFALVVRAYFGRRNNHQNYYMHLSNIWYDLRKQTLQEPDWINPEITTMYGINDNKKVIQDPEKYDSHAWACWALAEDCYETYWKSNIFRRLFNRHFKAELEQFKGPILNAHELHWAWLDSSGHACRFDKDFRDWIRKEFQKDRYDILDSNLSGTGIKACKTLETGNYIGCVTGRLVNAPNSNTLQVGKNAHIEFNETNILRFLNHSNDPNAMIYGRNIIAISDINEGDEITIDYNATEESMSTNFTTAGGDEIRGYLALSDEKKQEISGRIHVWIRHSYPAEQ